MSMAFAAEVRAKLADHECRIKELEAECERLRRLANAPIVRKRGRPPKVRDDQAGTENQAGVRA